MSSWWPGSGRYSPFTSFYNRTAPPPVTEEDYAYLSGENDHTGRHNSYGFPHANNSTYHHGGAHYRHGSSGSHRMEPPANLDPDQLILRHKGTTYPLHFPAFSISEGDLKVRDLRHKAARELRVDDPRRVKLLYKGKQMRDNDASCKHENLKQNSEVMCVVSSEPTRSSSESEDSGSVSTSADGPLRDDERKKKRKNHRGGKKKVRHTNEEPATIPQPANLAPPQDTRPATSRTPSPSPKKPGTPAEMLADIETTFDNEYAPKAREYLAHPPPDAKSREFEYKKLSETILAQVLLKLDGVETMGDDMLRGKRKELVKRVQGMLTELDRIGKPK